ncbi:MULTISPECIES: DUF4192 domain-containing protein [Nocardioides]|uniref:DUF4192 domain-containing protein n=1 Tax=Nocardioides TaxID=1839 RepID=UPI00203F5105|nr:DUF4192 domain-containing protein [Nocardioides sp. P86]MCM3513964.1 DUF4192 domain-containing protein [Nocardioides sp. P86]
MTTTPGAPGSPRPVPSTPRAPAATAPLVARTPEDVLAMVPAVLGFTPTQSVAMLTLGAARAFHARVDLPTAAQLAQEPDGLTEMVDLLRQPCVRHRVRAVLLVVFSDDEHTALAARRALVPAFRGSGMEVVDVLRADGRRWWPMLRRHPGAPPWGVPYDVSEHPFVAQTVLAGKVTHPTREDLDRSLDPGPAEVAAHARVAGLVAQGPLAPPGDTAGELVEAMALRDLLLDHHVDGTLPDPEEVARLLLALRSPRLRDLACALVERREAAAWAELWRGVLRLTPPELVVGPATVTAFCAWLAGEGALAWCALDRALAVDPDHSFAGLVGGLLTAAVPPAAWDAPGGPGRSDLVALLEEIEELEELDRRGELDDDPDAGRDHGW